MLPSYISWKKRQAIFMVKNWPTLLWPILRVKGEIWPEVTLEHIAAYHAHLPHIYLISLDHIFHVKSLSLTAGREVFHVGHVCQLDVVTRHWRTDLGCLSLVFWVTWAGSNYNHLSSHGQAGDLQGRWVCTGQHIQSGHSWRRKYLENKFLLLYSDSPLNDDATQGGAHKCEDIACQGSWPALTHSISQSD